ncbi:TatABCE protein translocation system subunit [Candidatus Filomicrobium marinum]|uniref:Sec-independent protein translocase protein TatA n=2 Tax=Filomicrobium TaxID=119044 RepID=A0A0D6JGS7_9HYPH|nr:MULTISPECIES: twin-arginine translocase TatA/TatE family subunit [Filomicrobium]MCV0369708.1 twin-arginine translocase TatA/TatE family subunit [Filomicrobium sp.]CFX48406.1 TatABCE protein translocation system subunit [Candidatus Filomicrobium marinum]CPR20430.1 TatABCE protein translocation system subunit [Candidatus Filomicrobium marinum]SDP15005.1 sec-independent protein translocase protein TatA [Filomicrobium insigne]
MGATSIWHWVILLLIVVLLFGRGKISEVMGDVAKGIKSFKKGMADEEDTAKAKSDAPKTIDHASTVSEKSETQSTKVG